MNINLFKQLDYRNDQLCEVGLIKSEIEDKEPIFVGFFILQNAKLRLLEPYCNFRDKYCDDTKFEELQMDTDSLYLTLSKHDWYDCIRPAMKKEWNSS